MRNSKSSGGSRSGEDQRGRVLDPAHDKRLKANRDSSSNDDEGEGGSGGGGDEDTQIIDEEALETLIRRVCKEEFRSAMQGFAKTYQGNESRA